jgi:hypothetical protein
MERKKITSYILSKFPLFLTYIILSPEYTWRHNEANFKYIYGNWETEPYNNN